MKTLALLALFVLLSVTLPFPPASALSVPEKLIYQVTWSGITAGTAVQEVTASGGELRIVYTVRSAGWLNPIFFIDDWTESVLSPG